MRDGEEGLVLPGGGLDGDPPHDLHLWKLPRGRHGLPPELVAQSQRERLLAAVVRVAAAKGYRGSSVSEVLAEAGVGRETFYRHFKDREDCFLAANDALLGNLERRVRAAYERPGPWPERARGGLAAALDWLAANPDVARVTIVEMGTVGPAASARFEEAMQRFTSLIEEADAVRSAAPLPHRAAIAAGAVFARIYEEVTLGECAALPGLLPQLTFELLLPLIGEEAAAVERERAAAQP